MKKIMLLLIIILLNSNLYAKEIKIKGDTLFLEDIIGAKIREPIITNLNFGERTFVPKERIRSILYRLNLLDKFKEYVKDYTVVREGTLLTEKELKKSLIEWLGKNYPNFDFEVERISYNNNIFYQDKDNISFDISSKPFGSTYIDIGNGYKKYSVYAYIKAFKDVYVAKKDIRRGSTLEGNVIREKVDVTNKYDDLVNDIDGLIARTTIRKGKPITDVYVEEKPALKRGASVKIRYKGDYVLVESKGVLREDAFVGKYVRVKNITSNKVLTGKYVGNSIVSVN
ncbi:MAG: flagellar basal body P-ring formation chaperone FlgA [Deferribacterota bacterium]|nr:flagellar basal body P-ring formation chaperone FlgA [Deferribacterota bacterium]